MANGKYTFEDMAAEKSNAQDLLDIYLRNKNPVPIGCLLYTSPSPRD